MPRFQYVVGTASNERRVGLIDAETAHAAADALRRQGLLVVRLRKPSAFRTLWNALNQDIALRPPLSASDLAGLSQEWAGLVEAGISVEDALTYLMDSCRPKAGRSSRKFARTSKAERLCMMRSPAIPRAFPMPSSPSCKPERHQDLSGPP